MRIVDKQDIVKRLKSENWQSYVGAYRDPNPYIEISEDPTFYVQHDEKGDSALLAANWLWVWERIPADVRSVLSARWKENLGGISQWLPDIRISNETGYLSSCENGVRFDFHPCLIELMKSDDLQRDVIAHELGHAYKSLDPKSCFRTLKYNNPDHWPLIETEADETAESWNPAEGPKNFNMARMRQWAKDNAADIKKCMGWKPDAELRW
jgi:hypothetical protein